MGQDDFSDPQFRDQFLRKVDLIEPRRVNYDKPIAIVYNPNSGKKRNIRGIIEETLK